MYPELFRIPFIDWPISSFGAALAIAFLVGYRIAVPRMREEGLNPDDGANMLIWIMIGGVFGAKLYYATDFAIREQADFFDALASRAGMTFYGGLMGRRLGRRARLSLLQDSNRALRERSRHFRFDRTGNRPHRMLPRRRRLRPRHRPAMGHRFFRKGPHPFTIPFIRRNSMSLDG